MKKMIRTWTAALLATLVLSAPAFAQKGPPDDAKVAAAIKKGVKWLKSQDTFKGEDDRHSERELVLLTLKHAGQGLKDAFFKKHFDIMLKETPHHTYRTALRAMVLEEVQRVQYQPELYHCAEFLVDNQSKDGYWGYGKDTKLTPFPGRRMVATGVKKKKNPGGILIFDDGGGAEEPKPEVLQRVPVKQKKTTGGSDNSNSQYAALGLRACHDGGIIIPREVIEKAITWWRESQEKISARTSVATGLGTGRARGWGYKKNPNEHNGVRGTMTAGAVGTLAIYFYMAGQDWKRDRDLNDGLTWLAANFTVTKSPGPGGGPHYYYLYALERAGMLYGTEKMGKYSWYNEGAHFLLGKQAENGSWGQRKNTCFAILFLRRATRALVESVDNSRRK